MTPTLGGISLHHNIAWIDEFDAGAVDYTDKRVLSGKLIRQRGVHSGGRPITLTGGPHTRATIKLLQNLQNTATATTLVLQDGRTFTVDFADGGGIEAKGVGNYPKPVDTDYYILTLHLIEIS